MVLSSTVVYFQEQEGQPQIFPDIPATRWGGGAYHDHYWPQLLPITPLGKLVNGLIIILGVATFALPTAIFTSGFVAELQRKREFEEAQERKRLEEGSESLF